MATKKRSAPVKSPAIVQRWRKGFAVGCSHGQLLDRRQANVALEFSRAWKADTMIHLGDYVDLAAFRRGGTEETQDPVGDIAAGLNFVEEFFDTSSKADKRIVFNGNHEDRLRKLSFSSNALTSYAATMGRNMIKTSIESLGAEVVDYDNLTGWRKLGDTRFGHGYLANMNGIRDHAVKYGRCVIAHLHVAGMDRAQREDGAICWCVGTLADISRMEYAKTHANRLRWSAGFVFFEYTESQSKIWLAHNDINGSWAIPQI